MRTVEDPEPTEAPTPEPEPEPSCGPLCLPTPTPPPEPTSEPTPEPTATAVTPSSTKSPSARPKRSSAPRSTYVPRTGSTANPLTGGVSVGPAELGTPDPQTTPRAENAASSSGSSGLTRLLTLVLGFGVLLGLAGGTGLYLTRHPHEH